MRVAAVQYEVGHTRTGEDVFQRIDDKVSEAVSRGAEVVAFPEYLAVDLLSSLLTAPVSTDEGLQPHFVRLADMFDEFVDRMRTLAIRNDILLIAGTFPRRDEAGTYQNAAQIFTPAGRHIEQEKLHVAYELRANSGMISAGKVQNTFEWRGVRIAVVICYDGQYPETCRAILDSGGVELIFLIGCTFEQLGVERLRRAASARAMESLSYCVNVQLSGQLPYPRDDPFAFYAESSIEVPACWPFEPGPLAVAQFGSDEIVVVDLDFTELAKSRENGLPEPEKRHLRVHAKDLGSVD